MEDIDWDDPGKVSRDVPVGLTAMSTASRSLRLFVEERCLRVERFPNFFKLVLAQSSNGASLRLHLFPRPGTGSRHSHRWAFGSRVIAGRMRHNLFEEDTVYAGRPAGSEPLVMSREEVAGVGYVLWPSHVHSIEALEPSLTLVLRGPETRQERFVDVPGVERGWARRYARVDSAVAGDEVAAQARAEAIGQALDLLASAPGFC